MAGEKILVVDDGKENREFVIDYVLKPAGFVPLQARDGMEGMEMARKLSPDLILLDLQMPRMNGIQVLEALRAEQLNIPVILMTFHGSEEIAVEVFRLGVRDYVKKPYTPDEMLSAIEASLTETRLRHEKEALTNRLLNANRDLHSRIKELNTLYAIGKSVTALINPPQLMARIVEAATQLTGAEQGNLWLLEGERLFLRATKRRGDAHARPAMDPSRDNLVTKAIQTGKPVVLSMHELARFKEKNPAAPSAVMIFPMVVSNRAMGALSIENIGNTTAFGDHDSALLSALGDYAAIAIENARNFSALAEAKDQENMRVRGAFEQYLAPSIVNRILSNSPEVPPPVRSTEIGLVYATLCPEVPYAQWGESAEVVELLDELFALVTDVALAREGMLDRLQGEGFLILFNTPIDQPDFLHRAADSAVALRAICDEFNARHGRVLLKFGTAVGVGPALCASIGTATHSANYTAVGPVVSEVRRLAELAKPGQILISSKAAEQLGSHVETVQASDLQQELGMELRSLP